jgi:hypothetical protein
MAKTPVKEIPGKAATTPKAKPEPLKVRATQTGYYDHARRREGDVFVVEAHDFSEKWMERVAPDTPTQVTTAQQALTQAHVETVAQATRGGAMTGTDRDVLG